MVRNALDMTQKNGHLIDICFRPCWFSPQNYIEEVPNTDFDSMNNFYWWQPKIWWQRPSFKFSTMLLGQVSAPPSTKGLSMLCCRTIWDLQRHILLKVRITFLWRSNLDPQRNYYNILKCDFPVFFCDTILDLRKNIYTLVDC